MRGKVFGYLALVICGVGIYLTGYAFGELERHRSESNTYFQGYRTGYIKGYRNLQKKFLQHTSYKPQPLKLNGFSHPSSQQPSAQQPSLFDEASEVGKKETVESGIAQLNSVSK